MSSIRTCENHKDAIVVYAYPQLLDCPLCSMQSAMADAEAEVEKLESILDNFEERTPSNEAEQTHRCNLQNNQCTVQEDV